MNNVLTAIAALMVLVLAALFTVPMMINWDDYRGDFEVRLSEIVGSKVELDGSLNVRLLPTPFVSAENLRIGESGERGRPVLEVKELTLWVAVPPLLKGIIEASTLTLDRPRLLLKFDDKGRPAFDVGAQKSAVKRGKDKVLQAASLSGFKLSPKLISLRNVKIINGDVELRSFVKRARKNKGNVTERRVAFQKISGVLSAVTLKGPFYFNGKFFSDEAPRFVRLALGKAEKKEKGTAFPVKGKITTAENNRRIEFDGSVGEKGGSWFARGKLKAGFGTLGTSLRAKVANVPESDQGVVIAPVESVSEGGDLPKSKQVLIQAKKSGQTNSVFAGGDVINLTSHLDFSSSEARFSKILVRSGSLARPQTVSGQVVVKWRDKLSLVGSADGKTIDLNVLLGGGALVNFPDRKGKNKGGVSLAVSPGVVLSKLNGLLLGQAKYFETIDFSAKVNQIYLGQGDVRDFKLSVKSKDGVIRIEDLAGRLPGSSRVTISGRLSDVKEKAGFHGQVYLRGLQFQEFIRWAVPSYQGDLSFGRGKFMLNGTVLTEGEALSLSGLQGDFGRSSFRGGVTYKIAGENQKSGFLRVLLRADQLNIEELLGKPVGVMEFESEISSFLKQLNKPKNERSSGVNSALPVLEKLNSVFELNAHRIVFKDSVQRDVRMVWRQTGNKAFIESLSGVSENGLKLVYETGQADPSGEDRFIIEASNAAAVRDLFNRSGFGDSVQVKGEVMARFLPLRLAVQRQTETGATQYRFDGRMGGSDVGFSVFVPLAEDGKSTGPMTVLGGMESANGALLVSKLLPFGLDRQVDAHNFGSAKLTFTASGTIEDGFKGQVNLVNKVMTASYLGRFALRDKQIASDGILKFSGENSQDVLGLFGLAHLTPLADGKTDAFKARGTFSQTVRGFALSDLKIAIGDIEIAGTGLFEEKDGQQNYRLAVATDHLNFGTLIGVLQGRGTKGTKINSGGVWSALPFRLSNNRGKIDGAGADETENKEIVGEYSIRAAELQLSDQLSLTDALVQWRTHKTHIEIIKIEGKSLGGAFFASGNLRQDNGSYSLNGLATLTKARLEEVGAAEEASLGSGEFSLNLSLSGVGSSPKALVSSLVGQGFVKISSGALRQVRPALLGQLAERYLKSESGDLEQLKSDLLLVVDKAEPIKVRDLDLGLQLIDGAIKLRQNDFGVKPGTLGVQAELKLVDLSWTGDWFIQPAARNSTGRVPGVHRLLKGQLSSSGGIFAELDVGEFERYLSLKHKERELRSLEKIRLEEQTRRLAEQKRLAEAELKRIKEEKERLKKEQKFFDELNRTNLPLLELGQ